MADKPPTIPATLGDEWNHFLKLYCPDGCPLDMETSLKRAFFAGSLTVITRLLNMTAQDQNKGALEMERMTMEAMQVCAILCEDPIPHQKN